MGAQRLESARHRHVFAVFVISLSIVHDTKALYRDSPSLLQTTALQVCYRPSLLKITTPRVFLACWCLCAPSSPLILSVAFDFLHPVRSYWQIHNSNLVFQALSPAHAMNVSHLSTFPLLFAPPCFPFLIPPYP